jgi:hypothetical protein
MRENLSILIPLAIGDAALTSSTVAENEYPAWAAGTTYAAGEFCISPVTHRVYRSLVDGNLGKDPTDAVNRVGVGTIPAYWQNYSATNKWAMFDNQAGTQTVAASPLTVVLHPGGFNAFWVGGIDAESLIATVRDAPGGNVILTATSSLEASTPGDYDEYFFSPFRPQTDYLASQIDQYSNAELTLTLTKTSGPVKCGMLAVGDLQALGATLRGVKIKPKSYAFVDTDEFGNTEIVPGKAAVDMDVSARIDLSEAPHVGGVLRSVMAVPVVVIAAQANAYSDLRGFGLISGEIDYDAPTSCLLTTNTKGMI